MAFATPHPGIGSVEVSEFEKRGAAPARIQAQAAAIGGAAGVIGAVAGLDVGGIGVGAVDEFA